MSDRDPIPPADLKVDQTNLYREEIFTDLKAATIRRLTPVKQDGTLDKRRDVLFVGQAQLLTKAGPLPVQAQIPAGNLQQAMERFPPAIDRAVKQLVAEAEELHRKEASRIVVPGSGSGSKIHVP